MAGYTGAFQCCFVQIPELRGTIACSEDLPYFLFEVNASVKKQLLLLSLSSRHMIQVLGVEQSGGCAGLEWSCSSCCCTKSSVVKKERNSQHSSREQEYSMCLNTLLLEGRPSSSQAYDPVK